MKRTNFHLTDSQLEKLRRLSDETGLSVSELVRRAIDDMLKREAGRTKKEQGRGETG